MNEEIWQKPQTKALWYSKYEPTEEQLEDFRTTNRVLIQLKETKELATMTLRNDDHVKETVRKITQVVKEKYIHEVYGFFPIPFTPHLMLSHEDLEKNNTGKVVLIPCFSSWTIKEDKAGSKPVFYQWVHVGYLKV